MPVPAGVTPGSQSIFDRALAGVYKDYQDLYHAGLGRLDTAANQKGGANFAGLEPSQQLELLTAVFDETLELAVTGGGATPAAGRGHPGSRRGRHPRRLTRGGRCGRRRRLHSDRVAERGRP